MKTRSIILVIIVIAATHNLFPQEKALTPPVKKGMVTFVELGSVNCVPCRQMQPVMKAIQAKYGDQVKVLFYDVWTREQQQYAQLYRIRVIPTQVFLDERGQEFRRHEGFFPEKDIDALLQSKGLKPIPRENG